MSNMYEFKCVNVASKVKIEAMQARQQQSQLKICPFALNVKAVAVRHTRACLLGISFGSCKNISRLNIKTKLNLYLN